MRGLGAKHVETNPAAGCRLLEHSLVRNASPFLFQPSRSSSFSPYLSLSLSEYRVFSPGGSLVCNSSLSLPLSPHPRISGGNKLELEKATNTWSRGMLRLGEINDFDLSL